MLIPDHGNGANGAEITVGKLEQCLKIVSILLTNEKREKVLEWPCHSGFRESM